MLSTKEMKNIINNNYINYGKNVYLLGTASFGPTNCPIKIKSLSHLYSIFGSSGTLIEAYRQVYNIVSNVNIYCCKITGRHSCTFLNVNIENDEVFENALELKAMYSSDIYNDVYIKITETCISFKFPQKLNIQDIEYYFSDYGTLGILVDQINRDTKNGLNCIDAQLYCDSDVESYCSLSTVNPDSVYLFGGDNGLSASKNTMYYCLDDTLHLLEGEPIDVIVPLNMYIDDIQLQSSKYDMSAYDESYYDNPKDTLTNDEDNILSYYDLLLGYCVQQLNNGFLTLGIMGYNPTSDMYLNNNKEEYIKIAVEYLNENKFNKVYENYNQLISVVIGDVMFPYLESNVNGYVLYAVKLASLNLMDCPTNKFISKNVYLYNEFDNNDLDYFSNNGLVSLRYSPLKEAVVFSSCVTTCSSDNLMYNIQNLKAIQFSVSCLYDIFQQYIGEDLNKMLDSNFLSNVIKGCFNLIKSENLISEYKFEITRESYHDIKIYLYLKTKTMADFFKVIHRIKANEG